MKAHSDLCMNKILEEIGRKIEDDPDNYHIFVDMLSECEIFFSPIVKHLSNFVCTNVWNSS